MLRRDEILFREILCLQSGGMTAMQRRDALLYTGLRQCQDSTKTPIAEALTSSFRGESSITNAVNIHFYLSGMKTWCDREKDF